MAPVEIVRPVGPHEHHRRGVEAAREVREELAGGSVGPVQVLEHEQGRDALGQPFENAEELLVQRARDDAFARRSVELGEQGGELVAAGAEHGVERRVVEGAKQRAQGLDDRAEGQRAIDEIEALPDEHERRLRDPGLELGDEARLADSGLARDHEGRGALVDDGRLPRRIEAREFGTSSDEPGARDTGGHDVQFGPASVRCAPEFGASRPAMRPGASERARRTVAGRATTVAACGTSAAARSDAGLRSRPGAGSGA